MELIRRIKYFARDFSIYLTSGEFKKTHETRRLNQGTSARKQKRNGEVYQGFTARENVWRKTAEERVATLNVDTGCVEEKIYFSSVFIDLSIVSISGK